VKFRYKAAVLIAGAAIGITPALATAHGKAHPNTPTTSKAKQYGKLCRGESKVHKKGVKGTPFSVCVTAAAKAANGSTKSPGQLCKAEKKMAHHMKGQKGTPFSDCVTAAAKAHKSGTTTSTSTSTTTTGTTTGTTST
jgi:hypothetical protein